MPVDKFGRMSDTKTKDTGVSLTYINNNYVRSDGGTPLTGSLDMRGNTIYNVADPVNPQDVVTKVYVDNTKHEADAVPREFVDNVIKELEEKIYKRKQLIAVHTRYCGSLKKGEYPFNFNGTNFENCKEVIEEYKDFKGSITGFLMPHTGYIKKIICEFVTFVGLESYTNFIFNFISDYKKDLKLSDLPGLEKAGYVDFEDVLKKGIDDLKKITEKENFFGENETKLSDESLIFLFQIVKFEKSFDSKDYPTIETPPKIISSVLLESMDVKALVFKKKMIGAGGFSRFFKNVNIVISEGDVINIKSKFDSEEIKPPISKNNMKEIFKIEFFNFITSNTNYNFTFLIELDPL